MLSVNDDVADVVDEFVVNHFFPKHSLGITIKATTAAAAAVELADAMAINLI